MRLCVFHHVYRPRQHAQSKHFAMEEVEKAICSYEQNEKVAYVQLGTYRT